MKTSTAHEHWDKEWSQLEPDSKWLSPEPDVQTWAKAFVPASRVLDLGAGVGRHALALADAGHRVTAYDAAVSGLNAIRLANPGVETVQGEMDDLPFEDGVFDHVLSWNVIYHGDAQVLDRTIAEIHRVLKPGGTFLGTMLSKRRLPVEQAKAPGREISQNTWVFEGKGDKIHPHYFCDGRELLEHFGAFEVLWLEDRPHDSPGSWHWHLIVERTA